MSGYGTRHVCELIGVRPAQLRHYVRRGLIHPERDRRGAYRFSFQDVLLLRTTRQLVADGEVSTRKALRALLKLKADPQRAANLTALRISTDGSSVVVRHAREAWDAETGQRRLEFEGRGDAAVTPLAPEHAIHVEGESAERELGSDDWYNLGLDLEETDPDRARKAYRRAIALDADNADAYVNLGRLLQFAGDLKGAKRCYRTALEKLPEHQLALYNLGTLYDELEELDIAIRYYRQASLIPDAHYNLARIHELRGDELAARRYLRSYRRLLESS